MEQSGALQKEFRHLINMNVSISITHLIPLEKEMATHSSILAWVIPWTGEPGGLQSMVLQELDTT